MRNKLLILTALFLGTGCASVRLTAEQATCVAKAEDEASKAALAICETNWDECAHAASIRNDFREDVNACLEIK